MIYIVLVKCSLIDVFIYAPRFVALFAGKDLIGTGGMMAAGCICVFIAQIHKSARVVIAALAKASHGYLAIIVAAKTETLPINGASIAVTFHVITHTFYCIRSRSFRPSAFPRQQLSTKNSACTSCCCCGFLLILIDCCAPTELIVNCSSPNEATNWFCYPIGCNVCCCCCFCFCLWYPKRIHAGRRNRSWVLSAFWLSCSTCVQRHMLVLACTANKQCNGTF